MIAPGLAARAVGRSVTFTTHGSEHHGVIVSASYNPMGEAVVVIHLDDNPVCPGANTILLGRDAELVVASLDQAEAA
jgi:hypothetical protein